MKRFVLLLTVASALAACNNIPTGHDPQVQCPSDTSKQMSHAEWEACYGYQDHDAGPGR